MSSNKFPVSSTLKYGVLIVAFAVGYQFAGKDYPQASALVGWVLGFLIGLKLKMSYSNERRNG
ncbi:MAG: hypothetical protein JST84_19875 [Acidobacteria bacterium]|nr:hypothetical protein [Acidobacteriota bacterium]